MRADQNQLLTRIGPGTRCGALLRRYWQPVALLDEFDPALDPTMAIRPVKAVRVLGQDLVLFRDASGQFGLLDRDCPHRGADLAFARNEGDGLRCPFHGWKFDRHGRCLQTPGEPDAPVGQRMCDRVHQRSYPVLEKAGMLFGWFGEPDAPPPPFPAFDCFAAPASHVFAFKGLWNCNWLQAVEVGIDPVHPSFLHRFFQDEVPDQRYGQQFRAASAGAVDGEPWPMSRVMRECHQPEIRYAPTEWGMQLTALRRLNERTLHVRVTQSVFPQTFVIPLSQTMTITQVHVPVDDTRTYWYSIFTSFADAIDTEAMRRPRLAAVTLPDYIPKSGRHNQWGFDPLDQRDRTFLGMGDTDINIHDQWAVESMGAIADRTREHLGTTDKVIIANRRMLAQAIDALEAGQPLPGLADPARVARMSGPDTVDGITDADGWEHFWRATADAKRAGAPWHRLDDAVVAVSAP
ncbi:MAG: Rieske 2Fe-2S domain-containing protein [Burkholderiaceae bacterium]